MTDTPMEDMDAEQQRREQEPGDALEREQEGKGYGEDEGERESSLPDAGSADGEAADARP